MTTNTEITKAIQNLKNMAERLEGLLPENNMFAQADPKVFADIAANLPTAIRGQLDAIGHETKRLRIILNS